MRISQRLVFALLLQGLVMGRVDLHRTALILGGHPRRKYRYRFSGMRWP